MSRIGKLPITVPSGVDVAIDGRTVTVKGPKGTLSHTVVEPITVERADDGTVQLKRPDDERRSKAMHGLSRSLVQNLVTGVTAGYEKKLEIVGVGYRVALRGANLEFALGFSHPVVVEPPAGVTEGYTKTLEIVGVGYRVQARGSDLEFALGFSHPVPVKAPEGITFAVESPTRLRVTGIDKQQVGEVAAKIRKIRKPDPYKGKGVRYQGEVVKRKVGKTGK